jgi:hypothetical protein
VNKSETGRVIARRSATATETFRATDFDTTRDLRSTGNAMGSLTVE